MRAARVVLRCGDALDVLSGVPAGSFQTVVTSPPYLGLRDYGIEGQYGLEETPDEYVKHLRILFSEVRRTLANDGTVWLNIADVYGRAFGRDKSLMGMPWRVALGLMDDGWIVRNEIVWEKSNAKPEPVRDRLSARHETLFLLSPHKRYRFDLDCIRQPVLPRDYSAAPTWAERKAAGEASRHGRGGLPSARTGAGLGAHPLGKNPGDVWTIPTVPYRGAHFATMPPRLAERCILATTRQGDTVLDPFVGSGTTVAVARLLGRHGYGIDLNPDYLALAAGRVRERINLDTTSVIRTC